MKKYYIIGLVLVGIILLSSYLLIRKSNQQAVACSKQANLVFENTKKDEEEGMSYSQTNHYNKLLDKCFMELITTITIDNRVTISDEVMDAYEQKNYLVCISGSSVDPTCFIPGKRSDTGKAVYMTKEEGRVKIQELMNN